MSAKYNDLHTLINSDRNALEYFNALPDYVREQITTRSQSVNSIESLEDYAENLLRGDN